ncbi:MAG: plasma-membrane proton-efflux P-type ATPase [Candidatus Micrarchaeia archaeon]
MPRSNRVYNKYEQQSVDTVLKMLNSSRNGLEEREANERLRRNGYNEIKEHKQSGAVKLLKKFYGPIPLMLEIVMVITFLIKDMKDFYLISALLVFNALVSFFEERKADDAVEMLEKRLSVNARVLRSGEWKQVQARELVVGDIIRLRIGDIVPADCKVISSSDLEADQSVLTGESLPVKKKASNIVYSGSIIKEGEATCIVTATGYDTYYGKTTKLVQIAGAKSHLQSTILGIARYLITFDIIVASIIFAYGILVLQESYATMLPFILVVLIASVPVALPAAFTVTMALGTKRLAERSVLVTKLDSIEETSTLNVICFDKTGTLTENRLEVKAIYTIGKHSKEEVAKAALFASRKEDNDPLDSAVIRYAEREKISTGNCKTIEFKPFQPKTKMASAKVLCNGSTLYAIKGAYSAIASMCSIGRKEKAKIEKQILFYSRLNYRNIAVAIGGEKPELIGIIALYDKPRRGAARLVSELRSLGVKVKMITGDNLLIAEEIAHEVGIGDRIADFSTLKGKSIEEMEKGINESDGFAEIFPEDKYTIVKTLQKEDYRVGMTGDGVNDAPALKQAEVGIAVENATDVAKSVAGIVLIKNGIDVIVDAIKESRRIFERMMTYTMVKVVKVIQIVLFVMVAFIVLKQVPILPFGLILLIFTNDITNIAISTDNAEYSKKPDTWNMRSISYTSLALGIVFMLITLLFIPAGIYMRLSAGAFQTFTFFMFVVTDQLLVYSLRSRKHMWDNKPSKWLAGSSVLGILAGAVFAYFGILITSIPLYAILGTIALGIAAVILFDFIKIRIYDIAGIRWHYEVIG